MCITFFSNFILIHHILVSVAEKHQNRGNLLDNAKSQLNHFRGNYRDNVKSEPLNNKPPLKRGTVVVPLLCLFHVKTTTPFTPFKW